MYSSGAHTCRGQIKPGHKSQTFTFCAIHRIDHPSSGITPGDPQSKERVR